MFVRPKITSINILSHSPIFFFFRFRSIRLFKLLLVWRTFVFIVIQYTRQSTFHCLFCVSFFFLHRFPELYTLRIQDMPGHVVTHVSLLKITLVYSSSLVRRLNLLCNFYSMACSTGAYRHCYPFTLPLLSYTFSFCILIVNA